MSMKARLAAAGLRSLGWQFVGQRPAPPKFVGLAVPHTSNMDGLLMVLMAEQAGLEMSWMVKDAVDKPVLGTVVRRVGGVFIDRSKSNNVVDQMIEEFARRDRFCLMIPPEGTRRRSEHWKSGFYHIALGAQVPVVPGFLDYGRKRGGFGEPFELTGNIEADMDRLRDFYTRGEFKPRYPEKFGPIRLREESTIEAR
jgi:1-acyl-sn-glycerol-3-phosphate acyltransferase